MEIVTRVFCTADDPPSLSELLEGVLLQEVELKPQATELLSGEQWSTATLVEPSTSSKLTINCLRGDELFRKEIQTFITKVQSAIPHTEAHDTVLDLLAKTRFVIKTTFTITDPDADAHVFDLNSAVVVFVSDNYYGLIQADGEGFYDEEDELLLTLD